MNYNRLHDLGFPDPASSRLQIVARVTGPAAGIAAFAAVGLACSAILPLSISFGGTEFPRRAAAMSGELIAFYQVGYGLAAFGVGPLRDLGNLAYSAAFSLGSVIALLLAGVAWRLVVQPQPSRQPKQPPPGKHR